MTRHLPLTPSAAHLRKQAKSLLHQCHANNAEAIQHVRLHHPALQNLTDPKIASSIRLCDAQLATAHSYGFENWAGLCSHVGSIYTTDEIELSPLEDPRFAELEFRAELARQKGLPAIGSTAISRHGVKYTVTDYQPAVSPVVAARIRRGGPRTDIDDLLPIITFPEMSPRLTRFCMETDCATSKDLMFLDTLPLLHRSTAAPGLNQVCSINGSTLLQFQLDASNIHETIIAHEMGHIWIEMIEGIEDYRHLRDQSNPAKVAQFQHLQSFVLDLRVNELLQERGFDMSIIRTHQTESIQNIANHCARGERPRTVRAAAGLINTLASVMIEQRGTLTHRSNNLSQAFEITEIVLPAIYEAAGKFVASVERHGYRDMEAVKHVVDECAELSFAITGDSFDPDRDLIELKPTEWMQDKHPEILPDLPVNAKIEVYRTTAKLGIFGRAQYSWTIDASGRCEVTITTREGEAIDPVVLTFQVSPHVVREWQHPHHPHSAYTPAGHRPNPLNNSVDPNNGPHVATQPPPMSVSSTPVVTTRPPNPPYAVPHVPQQVQHSATHLPMPATNGVRYPFQQGTNSTVPPHTPHTPLSAPHLGWPNPNAHGQSRSYSAGLGLWLSQVGFDQQVFGEQPYGYAFNNPVTYIDPEGSYPQKSGTPKQSKGSGSPNQNIGKGGSGNTCPGTAAYNLIVTTMNKNKDCKKEILKLCLKGFASEVALVPIEICKPTIPINDSATFCIPNAINPPPDAQRGSDEKGNKSSCVVGKICFNQDVCDGTKKLPKGGTVVGRLAGDLLFEMMNWCNCKYHSFAGGEGPANHVIDVCKITGDTGAHGRGDAKY